MKLLVDEIRVVKKEVHLSGSYSALAGALCIGTKRGTFETVPSSDLRWLPKLNDIRTQLALLADKLSAERLFEIN